MASWCSVFGSDVLGFSGFGGFWSLRRGSIGVPFWGSYSESCKVIPKRNYYGAYMARE